MINNLKDFPSSSGSNINLLDDLVLLKWSRIALVYLIIAGILGAALRLAFVIELPEYFNYKYILHAHSHVAIMGWIFSGLYILIVKYFNLRKAVFRNIFWMIQVCIVGMLLSFPVQGYGLVSILFTSLHMFLSYAFILYSFKELKSQEVKNASTILLKTAFVFLFISTLGTWALGFIMNSVYKGSAIYYASIQFFLHFQFNGWFVFAILAICAKILEKELVVLSPRLSRRFYLLMVLSCIFTYTLAVTWSTPMMILFLANSLGVLLQFAALIFLYFIYNKFSKNLKHILPPITFNLWKFAAVCLVLKIGMQTLVAIPYLATISYTIKNFVIGFIHLLMLGTLSTFIIGSIQLIINQYNKRQKLGIAIFIIGFLVVEMLLFLQGVLFWLGEGFIPWYYYLLFFFSLWMPIGILIYTLYMKTQKISA